jgi:hypothetical protein
MRSTNIRNMFDLYRKKMIQGSRFKIFESQISNPKSQIRNLFILLIISTLTANAQLNKPIYQGDYDAKKIKFGYFIGLPSTHFNLEFNNYYVQKDPAYSVTSPNTMGLKMGGLMNIQINDYFDFRFQPTVAIYGRRMEFKYAGKTPPDGFQESTLRETAWFEVPVMLKFKSERRGNIRMYMFAGLCYGIETNAVNRKNAKQFSTTSSDFSIQYGVGMEFFKEYFKFAPELHFSHGLSNLTDPVFNSKNNLAGLSSMTTHTVTLYFLFE